MILGSRRGKRREREEDNEVEVNDMTVHFKGDGRREEEGRCAFSDEGSHF